jgi:succinate-semialdehyde dehydrogenase/glutarate-semialdehyde dehydrogenase
MLVLIGFLRLWEINMQLDSINPKNNLLINSWDIHSVDEVNAILEKANGAYLEWKNTQLSFRINCLESISELLKDRSKEYGVLMSDEMGKPLSQGIAEIEKCAWVCDYYHQNAPDFLSPKNIETDNHKSLITFQPIGLVLGVMPWNFPFWQVFRFAIPSLTAGNGAVLKHASNVQRCANAIENCFIDAGYYENIFSNLCIPGNRVDTVIENPNIAAITLTGSTPAGKAVAKKAGECLKKTVLELGGSDPYVILDDNLFFSFSMYSASLLFVTIKRFAAIQL